MKKLGLGLAVALMASCALAQPVAYLDSTTGKVTYVTQSKPLPTTGGGAGGNTTVVGPTADGSAASTAPVLTAGTTDGTGTGLVSIPKISSGGDAFVNIDQINGAAPSLTNPIWVANAEANDVTGTFTNGTQTTSITNTSADGYATGLISINGTYATASGVFEESDDSGTTWYSIICTRSDGTASETGYTTLTNTNRQWSCPVGGNDSVRVRSTAVATGTVNARVGVSTPTNNSGIANLQINGAAVSTAASGLPNVALNGLALSTANFAASTVIFPSSYANPAGSFGPLAATMFMAGPSSSQDAAVEASALPTGGTGVQAVELGGMLFNNIKTGATTTVKSGAGTLHCINVNTEVASATISVFDNTAGSGTTIAKLTFPLAIANPAQLCYDLHFSTGLTIITSGATDITVTYR